MSAGFDAIRTTRSRRPGCAKCGEKTAAAVAVIARARAESGKGFGQTITSKTANLCEYCTVEVYTAVEAALLATIGEQGR